MGIVVVVGNVVGPICTVGVASCCIVNTYEPSDQVGSISSAAY